MQLLILYTVFHFAITHDTYAVADHKGYHEFGIVEYITPTLPVYLAIHFVHIVYIVYMFSCIAYEPMAYGINELELEEVNTSSRYKLVLLIEWILCLSGWVNSLTALLGSVIWSNYLIKIETISITEVPCDSATL